MSDNKYIQSITRAMSILNFVSEKGCVRLKDICEFTNLNKSTVFGLLKTLEHTGYLTRVNKGLDYSLGINCLKLGICYDLQSDRKETIHKLLSLLVDKIGETAYFEIKTQEKYYYYDYVQSKHSLKVVLDDERFVSLSDKSAVTKIYKNYQNNIKYATDLEEVEVGLNCFAAPFMVGNEILGCVALSGPSNRFLKDNMEDVYNIFIKTMLELNLEEHILK
ncbi:MAG: IclR family transcriptional regulator [Pleomorphochaeta sp.]